jgi:peptide subunit release factor 1 (eRF1)
LHKLTITGIATLIGLVVLASTATAGSAKRDPGVLKRGKCSVHSAWKLKAKNDDGRIETAIEVDQNRVGKRWRVTIFRNGSKVFSGIRTTRPPSGSFEVGRLLAGI